jgi:hypothetical protein
MEPLEKVLVLSAAAKTLDDRSSRDAFSLGWMVALVLLRPRRMGGRRTYFRLRP